MRAVMRGARAWRRFYGDNPLHLLAMLGCFALAGYVVSMVYDEPDALLLLAWFVGAVVAHDLVLYPLYALADGSLRLGRWVRRELTDGRTPRVPAVNHLRVPVMGAAVLGLIFLPTIARTGEEAFRFTSARSMAGYGGVWLLITAVLFLGSALVYAIRLGRSARTSV